MSSNWILLGEARSRILKVWITMTAILLLFFLIQQAMGVIEGVYQTVWGWFFSCLFPVLLILGLSTWIRRRNDKVLTLTAFRALLWLEALYFILIFCTFFLSRAALRMNDFGLDVYYLKSLWILLPINILLFVGLAIVFFSREGFVKINSAAIIELAGQKAAESKRYGLNKKNQCFEAIRSNNVEAAFEIMGDCFQKNDADANNMLILLQNRFKVVTKDKDLNIIQPSDAQIDLNKIMVALIDLANNLKE